MTTVGNRSLPLSVEEVRLLIGDLDEATRFFTDDQIRVFISMASGRNPRKAVFFALTSLAATYANAIGEVKVLGYSGDGATVATALRLLAREYNSTAGPIPLVSIVSEAAVPVPGTQEGFVLGLE